MAEPNWYCNKDGHRLGPLALAQLKQMAAAGMVAPTDLVIRESETEWVKASSVPELFPPPAPKPEITIPPTPGPQVGPLVVCEKCHAKISDVTEHCPQCGHPQIPFEAKQRGEGLLPCPQCKTLNRVRTYWEFLAEGVCRGCGRPNTEMYPQQLFECQVDEVFRNHLNYRNGLYWGIIGVAVIGFAVGTRFIALLFSPELNLVGLIGGGIAGYAAALPLFSMAYFRLFVRGRGLPPPNEGRTISTDDWGRAERREDQERWRKEKAAPTAPHVTPWWDQLWWAGAVVFVVLLIVFKLQDDRNKGQSQPQKPPPPQMLPMPVEVEFRPSAIGKGMVVRVKNTSIGELSDLQFTFKTAGGKVADIGRALKKPLGSGDRVEIGWAELGRELQPGDTVEMWVPDGLYAPYRVVVPAKTP